MKIEINLLPQEFRVEEIKKSKFYKVQTIGVGAILIMAFLSSLTVALRILQSRNVRVAQDQFTKAEAKVEDFKDKQAQLVLLKNRLGSINQYLGVYSKQNALYQLISKLLPSSVSVNSLTIDRSGNVLILLISQDAVTLDNLISTLITKDTNEDRIQSVSVESLNRGRDSTYRVSLKIKPK